MRTSILLALALIANTAFAEEEMIQVGSNFEQATLLVEETPDGEPGESVLVEGAPEESGFWEIFDLKGGINVTGPSPFIAAGGRLGLALDNEILEIGVEGTVFWFPLSEKAVGVSVGAYLQLAPIPGEWGRRFYIHGKVYRAFAMGKPTFNAVGTSFGLGYRQPIEVAGKERYLTFEFGLDRAWMLDYKEALWTPLFMRIGFVF